MKISIRRQLLLSLSMLLFSFAVNAQSPATTPEPTNSQDEAVRREVERQMAERDGKNWKFGVRPNGGGFFFTSPDEKIQFRLLGYAQAVGTLVNEDFENTFGSGDARVRRARVGWLMTFDKTYELFIEYDGVPQTGNLVEARLNWMLRGDDLQLRAGKFVVPFSEEGWRSSRAYDTVERFIAINSMYGLPALDTQIGVMVHGQVLRDNRLTYYAGVWNGNASAAENNRDNNSAKEYQAKVIWRFTPALRAGVGVDFTDEERQTLRLNSLTGTRYAAVQVEGKRSGLDADFFFERGPLSFRGEAMHVEFGSGDATLSGAFLQSGYFVSGNYDRGFQPLVRIERAVVDDSGTASGKSSIDALTAGFQWFVSNNVRLQVNGIVENFNHDAGIAVRDEGIKPSLLTELQIRF